MMTGSNDHPEPNRRWRTVVCALTLAVSLLKTQLFSLVFFHGHKRIQRAQRVYKVAWSMQRYRFGAAICVCPLVMMK
jgi:hypothetical protein